jgi:P pilus assembly chaperone PapD
MNKRPLIMLLLLGPLVLCGSLFGQVTQMTTQIVSQDGKTVTYRVTNNSDKPLTCYSVAVDITHNDGEVDHGEQSECSYDSKGALAARV